MSPADEGLRSDSQRRHKVNERVGRARRANAKALRSLGKSEKGGLVHPGHAVVQQAPEQRPVQHTTLAAGRVLSTSIRDLNDEIEHILQDIDVLEHEVHARVERLSGKGRLQRAHRKLVHASRFAAAKPPAVVLQASSSAAAQSPAGVPLASPKERRAAAESPVPSVGTKYAAGREVFQVAVLESAAAMAAAQSRAADEAKAEYKDWQTVPTADGKTYYWNTATNEVTWSAPWAAIAERRRSRTDGVQGMNYGGARHDVASLVFRKYDTSTSGELSDDELYALCAAMDHPVSDASLLALFKKLIDVDGDGRVTRADFVIWWRLGEHRWDLLTLGPEHVVRVRGLAAFFDAFHRRNRAGQIKVGPLEGVELERLHLCLRQHGHTSKSLTVFLTDIDQEGEHKLSLHKFYEWFFREVEDREPPKMPTRHELTRSIYQEARGELDEYNERKREIRLMKERAGRKLAFVRGVREVTRMASGTAIPKL